MSEEDDFLSHTMTIKPSNTIAKERIWVNRGQRDCVSGVVSKPWQSVARGACHCSSRRAGFSHSTLHITTPSFVWLAVLFQSTSRRTSLADGTLSLSPQRRGLFVTPKRNCATSARITTQCSNLRRELTRRRPRRKRRHCRAKRFRLAEVLFVAHSAHLRKSYSASRHPSLAWP